MPIEIEYYVDKLKEMEQKLAEMGYEMFMVYGGLLASIRNKRPIPYDKDIDVAIISKSESNDYASLKKEIESISKEIGNNREITRPRPSKEWGGLRFTTWTTEGGAILRGMFFDVYLAFEDPLNNNNLAIYNFYPRVHGKSIRHYSSIPKKWIFPLKNDGKLLHQRFKVPVSYKNCLSVWYGNWKVPKEGYFNEKILQTILINENDKIKNMT